MPTAEPIPNPQPMPSVECRFPSENRHSASRTHTAPLCTPHAARRTAFTTIEVMTAIAIVIILAAIFAFAFRHVGSGAQRNQTNLLLERLRNATAEVTGNRAAADDFFTHKLTAIYTSAGGAGTNTIWYDVKATSPDAYLNTKRVLAVIESNEAANKIIQDIPTQGKKLDTVILSDKTAPARNVTVPLDSWGNPILFVYDNWQRSTGNGSAVPMLTPAGAPTGGLSGLVTGTANDPYPGPNQALRAPDRRPFWVSAGPDGKYETQDDNVYSFEGQ